MKIKCIIFLLIIFACNKKEDHKIVDINCDEAVCLQLRNHNSSDKTFDIYMLNSTPIDEWQKLFSENNIEIEDGPVQKAEGTVPIMSLYVRDPDLNLIKIFNKIEFEPTPCLNNSN